MSFADRLEEALDSVGNPCLLGIDPHPDLLPDEFAAVRNERLPRARRAQALAAFGCALVDLAAGRVAAVKPQSAFFELLGADGISAWEQVLAHAHDRGLLVIGDVKRGDISSSARAYALAHLAAGPGRCDAITVNPLLGLDSLEPFLELCRERDAGIYVLVRTSNPGSADFQRHGEPELSVVLARAVARLGETLVGKRGWSSVGAVVGANEPAALARLRELLPRSPLLVPGYGAQGGGALGVRPAFDARGRGALVNSSRAIAFAHREPECAGLPWRDAARNALERTIAELASVAGAEHS